MAKALGILAVALAFLAAPAAAQESKCTAAKHQAAGDYARALEACRAKALKKGVPIDPACDAKALAKLEKQFAKAEQKADCIVDGRGRVRRRRGRRLRRRYARRPREGPGRLLRPARRVRLGARSGALRRARRDGRTARQRVRRIGDLRRAARVGRRLLRERGLEPPELTCSLSSQDDCAAAGGDAYVSPAVCTTSRCVRFEGAPPK